MNRVRMSMVLIVLVLLAGPWGWTAATGGEIVRQGVLIPYEITGPEGWSYKTESHQYVLGVFRPEGDDLFPYISITKTGGYVQLMRAGYSRIDITPEELVELNLFSRPGARLLSSRWLGDEENPYLLAEFSWSSELGEVRSIKAFHPWQDMVLVITATCLSAEYDEYQQMLIDAVMSVRVKKYRDPHKKSSDKGSGGDDWLYDE